MPRTDKLHIQKDSFDAVCGRRIGTPRGKIYPGVTVVRKDRLPADLHGYCKTCVQKAKRQGLIKCFDVFEVTE